MKVIYVATDNNASSGAFICLVRLAEEMKSRGIEVKVILPVEGSGTELLSEAGIPFTLIRSYNWDVTIGAGFKALSKIPIKKALNLVAIRKIESYLKEEKPNLVHINTTYSYVAAIAAYRLGIPVVWHIREFFEEDQNNRMWNREKGYSIIGKADALLAISHAVYDKYSKIFHQEKLQVINDGVMPERFYAPEREILEDDEVKLVSVGGLYRYKGQSVLIEAVAEYLKRNQAKNSLTTGEVGPEKESLKRNLTKLSLTIVGDGPEKDNLIKLSEEKGISDIVRFEGYSSTPEKYYKEADISFMTSNFEAFGLVTVEAMLSGALVIGTDCAGTKDIIDDKKTGLLYEAGNCEALVKVMEYALSNKEEMRSIAKNGRQKAIENFTIKANADRIEKVYLEVVKK